MCDEQEEGCMKEVDASHMVKGLVDHMMDVMDYIVVVEVVLLVNTAVDYMVIG